MHFPRRCKISFRSSLDFPISKTKSTIWPTVQERTLFQHAFFCAKAFSYQTALIRHMKSDHSENSKNSEKSLEVQCDQCPKVFSSRGNLNIHKKGVHEKTKLKCDDCGHETSYRSALNKHKKLHLSR